MSGRTFSSTRPHFEQVIVFRSCAFLWRRACKRAICLDMRLQTDSDAVHFLEGTEAKLTRDLIAITCQPLGVYRHVACCYAHAVLADSIRPETPMAPKTRYEPRVTSPLVQGHDAEAVIRSSTLNIRMNK